MTSTVHTSPTDKIRDRNALIEIIGGYVASQALAVTAELKLADLIHAGRTSSTQLAEATNTHQPTLRRLLRTLVAIGLLTEPTPDEFRLTNLGEQLRADSPDSLWAFTRFFTNPTLFASWQQLRYTLDTGECAFDHVYGKNIYDYLAEQPELSALFNTAMSQESRIAAQLVAHAYDFSQVKTVVDVGGGDGTLLAAILGAHPHLTGVCFDSASGVAGAAATFDRAGVADRSTVVAGDFFESVPDGGQLYIVKSVLQDWDDEHARRLLRTVGEHMPADATLLVIGSVLPDTANTDNLVMYYTDINMAVTAGGRERTENELRTLLSDAGFAVESVRYGAAGPLSIIVAAPTNRVTAQ